MTKEMNCKNCKWLSGDLICASPYSLSCGLKVYPFMWCKSWEEDIPAETKDVIDHVTDTETQTSGRSRK